MVELSYTIHLCDKYLYSREGCFFMSEGLLTDKQTEEVIRFLKAMPESHGRTVKIHMRVLHLRLWI